jgi:F-type H+-transporting ATPase subunit gamma
VNDAHSDIFTRLNFTNVREIGEVVLNAFTEKQYDVVEILFNYSKNVATQIIQTEQLLPLVASESGEKASSVDYIFEPSEEEIISELIPKSIKLSIFRAILESNSSEHGARMTAMDKATDNAGELIKALKLEYNRSRQAAITKEILEIVGGAEALNA